MFKLHIILPCLIIMFQPLNAKVEAPNYNFSLDALSDFFPDKKLADLEKKMTKGEAVNEVNGIQTIKFNVSHAGYKFPVLVQVKEGVILDFFARLPSYFLHDLFLQSLVNRYGKQNSYKKVGEEAFYVWDKSPLRHVYSGACTITCFPIFYTVHPIGVQGFQPLIQQMQKGVQKK
jgi:hypothetical protein